MEQQASADDFKKNVLLLKPRDVTERGDHVFTPTLNILSKLRKTDQFKRDLVFSRNMSAVDVRKKLVEAFPELENKRFSCAKRDNRDRADLNFKGDRRVWDGETIKKLPGSSAMYIFVQDETSQVQGAANDTDCLSAGQHPSSYTPPDLESVNPGRFDAYWQDVVDVLNEECKYSDGLRSCQSQTMQTASGLKISESSEPNRIDVNTGEISETGYSSGANSTQAQELCQEGEATTSVTRKSFRVYQARETAYSSDEASSTQGQGLFQETVEATGTQNPSRLFHSRGTADSSEEGSSSKEQTFDVTMNPKSSRPEGGNRCFWLKFQHSLPSSVTFGWATFGAYGSVKVSRISDDDFAMFGKEIPRGRPGLVTVTITTESGYLGNALFTYEDPENETNQQVLCNKRKIEELSDIVQNMAKMFKQQRLVSQEGQVEPQSILKALVYAAAEAGDLKLIKTIFSLSAGRVAFQAYKEDIYLPEDIAEENGHRDVAAYLRATTKRYSEEFDISTDQSRSVGFDWSELANALEDIELNQSVTKPSSDKDLNKIWEDDIIETGYSADGETSSSGSEKENSDSDVEFVKISACRESRDDEKQQQPIVLEEKNPLENIDKSSYCSQWLSDCDKAVLVNQEDRRFHEKESPSEVECCEAVVDEPSSDSLQLLITDVLDIIQEDSNQVNMKDNLEQITQGMEQIKDELNDKDREKKPTEVVFMEDLIGNIRRTYESHEGSITPFLWLQDFPFGPDIYTRLSMDSQEKNARETATPKVVEMTKIFESHEECKQTKKVLIEGKPGIGKTTLCNKIAYDWATKKHGGDDCFPQFESILLLKCRDVGVESNVWEAIGDQLLPREVQRDQREDFFEFIRRNQSKVLLVLDGLDELPPSKLPEFTDIIQGRMLPRCHLVVTARHEAGILVKKVCYTLIEIEGFTLEDAFEFITKFFKGKEELVQGRLDKLENDSSLQEMTANPLNTVLLCLLCEDLQGVLPENRTQLYLEIVQCVLIRYRKRKAPPVDKENMVELHKEQLSHLGSIALDCLYEDQMYFGANQLANQHTKLPGFGALSAQPGSKRRPSLWYSFTHKCFHEFLAGRFVCCHLGSKQSSPEMFFTGTKFFRELRQVLHFTCGLLAVSSEESLVALINGVANEGNKKDTEERLLVALERMKECRKGGSDFLTQLARSFGSSLKAHKVDLSDKRMDKAGAAVLGLTLETNTTLTQLNMSGNNLGPVGAESLATALKRNTKFNLSGKNLGSTVVRSIAVALEMNKHLTESNLSTNQLGPAGAESLAVALKTNTTLTVLYLSGNNLGPAGAESLAAALKANSTVTQLNLSYNNIGPVGAKSFAVAVETNATLTDLSLLNNALGPAGAESLATALRTNATLTDLYLYDNKLGPGGAKSLAAVLETNKSLTSLDLSHNYLGPADAESLAATLKRNSTLTDLNLFNNDLGPAGTGSLATTLTTNTTLKKLNLSRNNLSPEDTESLATALKTNTSLTKLVL